MVLLPQNPVGVVGTFCIPRSRTEWADLDAAWNLHPVGIFYSGSMAIDDEGRPIGRLPPLSQPHDHMGNVPCVASDINQVGGLERLLPLFHGTLSVNRLDPDGAPRSMNRCFGDFRLFVDIRIEGNTQSLIVNERCEIRAVQPFSGMFGFACFGRVVSLRRVPVRNVVMAIGIPLIA